MRRVSVVLLALGLWVTATQAGWRADSVRGPVSASNGLEQRALSLTNDAGTSAKLNVVVFDPKRVRLRLIDNPGGSRALADAVSAEKGLAGVNGGYFDPQFRPLGLRIVDGKKTSPLLHARLLTGVLAASAGKIGIERTREFSARRKWTAALQCGPLLVDHGAAVHGLNDTRDARRTFAATFRGGLAVLGISDRLTLAQLAEALASVALRDEQRIDRALNLDGGSSTAFYFANADAPISISEQKTVREFVVLSPK